MSSRAPQSVLWILPLFAFILFIPFSSDLDIKTAQWFLREDGKFHAPQWCLFIYTYGLIPGQILFVGSTILFCISFFSHRIIQFRWYALYISLILIVGSGFFGHAVFKKFWNRPRPKQVELFGGKYPYCSMIRPYTGSSDRFLRSFPSGHATIGYYFFSLYFLGKRLSQRWLSRLGLCITSVLGSLIAWARMAQGGHFLSDIVVSLFIMWMTAYWLDYYFERKLYKKLYVNPHLKATPTLQCNTEIHSDSRPPPLLPGADGGTWLSINGQYLSPRQSAKIQRSS